MFGHSLFSNQTGQKTQVCNFTANGTWTCPTNARKIVVVTIGGGGGGGGGRDVCLLGCSSECRTGGNGGGGGGITCCVATIGNIPSTACITIGAGGCAGICNGDATTGPGKPGHASCFVGTGFCVTAPGGQCCASASSCNQAGASVPGCGGVGNLATGNQGGQGRSRSNGCSATTNTNTTRAGGGGGGAVYCNTLPATIESYDNGSDSPVTSLTICNVNIDLTTIGKGGCGGRSRYFLDGCFCPRGCNGGPGQNGAVFVISYF
jgi:hypothetical protein